MDSELITQLQADNARLRGENERLTALLEQCVSSRVSGSGQRIGGSRVDLQAILDATSDYVGTADPSGRLGYLNRAGRRLVGISETADLGEFKIADMHPSWATERILNEGIPAALRQGVWRGETALLTREGREIPISQVILAHWSPIGHVEFLSTIARDISAEKEAERRLKESREEFRAIAENIPLPLGITDTEGRILFTNRRFTEFFGYRREEIPTTEAWFARAYPDPAYRQWVISVWAEDTRCLLESDVSVAPVREYRIIRKDGVEKNVEISFSLVNNLYHVVFIDITERKQAEAALRESEAKFRHLIDASPVAMGITDAQGNIEYLNARFSELFGYRREDIAHVEDWYARAYPDPTYRQLVTERWIADTENAQRDGTDMTPTDVTIVCRDGSARVAEVMGALIGDKVLAIFNDITERKRAEEALERQRAELLDVQNIGKISSFNWNLQDDSIAWTPEFFQLVERDPASFPHTGESYFSMIHPDDRDLVARTIEQSLAGEIEPYGEYRFVTPAGRVKFVVSQGRVIRDEQGRPLRMLGFNQDISERKRAEQALQESKNLLSLAFEAAKAGAWQWNLRTREIIWSDENFRIFGLEPRSVKPDYALWKRYVHPDDLARADARVTEMLAERQRDFNFEYRLITPAGVRWINSIGTLHRDDNGEPTWLNGAQIDITERKLAEERVRQSERRFREMLENVNLVAIILDAQGNITFCNDYLLSLVARPRDQTIGQNWFDLFIPDEERETLRTIFQETIQGGEFPLHHGNEIETAHGKRLIAWTNTVLRDDQGKIISMASLGEDITERRKMEQALRESERKFREIAENVPFPLGITDLQGRIVFMNKQHEDVFGYTLEEIADVDNWLARLYPDRDYREQVKAFFEEDMHYLTARGLSSSPPRELRLTCRDGTEKDVESMFAVVEGNIYFVFHEVTARKQAESALRESEDRFAAFMDNLPAVTFIKNQDSRALFVNRYFRQHFGEGWLDKSLSEMLPPDLAAAMTADDRRALVEGYCRREEEVPLANGEVRLFETFKFPLHRANKPTLIGGFAIDITERKRAEQELSHYRDRLEDMVGHRTSELASANQKLRLEMGERQRVEDALRESEARVRMALEVANAGSWEWHPKTNAVLWSSEIYRVYGRTPATFAASFENWKAVLHPDDRDRVIASLPTAFAQRKEFMVDEFRIVHPDGTERWISDYSRVFYDAAGEPERQVGINIDITERKQAEEELEHHRDHLEALVLERTIALESTNFQLQQEIAERRRAEQALKLTQFTVDQSAEEIYFVRPDGGFDYVNEAACRGLGYSREELLRLRVTDIAPEYPVKKWPTRWQTLKEAGHTTFETLHKTKSGEICPVEITANYLRFDNMEYICAFVRDIRGRKAAEEKIKASLQEKEVLLKEIHHRVKNNLQVITSLLDLQAEVVEDRNTREKFRESRNRVRSMALIHERLYRAADLASIDLAEYVKSLTDSLFSSYSTANRAITSRLDIEPLTMSVERAVPCGLIINELITNALKYAFPNGGPGVVGVELRSAADNQVVLRLWDTGVGLPADVDFHRLTSLGLTIVSTLVKQLRGTLNVRRDKGTEFTMTFRGPVDQAGAASLNTVQ